jgi:hypothetical protein
MNHPALLARPPPVHFQRKRDAARGAAGMALKMRQQRQAASARHRNDIGAVEPERES